VFAEDTDLEAELGVDSVKQTELLARVSTHYALPAPGEDFRLSAYGTLGRIADLVLAGAPTGTTPAPAETEQPTAEPVPILRVPPAPDRAGVLRTVVSMYAQALEYPAEVFAEDTDLEAELGVDSVKQTELLARVSTHYALPAPGEDFRLSAYGTLGRIADLVLFQTARPELLSA
jgi:acyl carrier protein